MARYRKRDAIEERLSDRVEAEGRAFTADLIAKRATGIQGYRMTLAFLELGNGGGSASFFVELEPAGSREEAQERADRLRGEPERLRRLLAEQISGSS